MINQHPITPPPELIKQWTTDFYGTSVVQPGGAAVDIATQAARWGADQQLAKDAKWLDQHALDAPHLKITPVGESLIETMRPKPPSLKEQALDAWDRLKNEAWCEEIDFDLDFVRRALEALPE